MSRGDVPTSPDRVHRTLRPMSNENPVGHSSSDHDRAVSLRDYAALERELSALKELIDIRADGGDSPGLEDIWLAGQPVGRIIVSNQKTAKSAREEARATGSNPSDPQGESGESGDESGDGDGMLPIERLARLKESDEPDSPFAETTPSVDRAVAIYEHFRSWSDSAGAGRVIKSGLKSLLETATGESLYWSQVQRACRALSEYAKGEIEYKKTDRHGWILVADEQTLLAGRG